VEVQTIRREQRVSEAIPQREQMPVDKPVDITLNNEALARIMAETAEVSRILGQALCETESKIDESDAVDRVKPSAAPEAVTYTINSSLPFSTEQLAALDKRYYAPLAEIMKEQVWSSDDLAKLAKRHQLMRTGMLDTINSWAYDSLGDEILFEEDNMYKVNQSLVGA
jgi:hypothetical protein